MVDYFLATPFLSLYGFECSVSLVRVYLFSLFDGECALHVPLADCGFAFDFVYYNVCPYFYTSALWNLYLITIYVGRVCVCVPILGYYTEQVIIALCNNSMYIY